MRPGRTHYLRRNEVTRVPRTFIYLDSEAHQRDERGARVQSFRLAVAACDRRLHHRDGWAQREWATFDAPADVWAWVDSKCHEKARTVLVAHKLDYDMRITGALRYLVANGWQLKNIRLESTQAWASWKHGTRTLVMCDSLSWLSMPLAKIGEMIGVGKLDLPAWDDTDEAWLARCTRDVEIIADAYRRLVDWVKRDDMGNWKPTGAGQAWAAFRHKHMTHRLLVHENESARAAERLACYTGRCEAWQHGKLHNGPYTEWDYSTAYTRIGADSNVPTQLIGEATHPQLDGFERLTHRHRVLAECTITTDAPTVPTIHDGRMLWPVGTFQSTLWDTEIALARDYGARIRVERCWYYKSQPALRSFCEWCLEMLDERNTDIDPVVRAAVKHWSRALIGRFAARWSSWQQVGVSPVEDIALGWAFDASTDERWKLLQLGAQLIRQTGETDSPDAVVSVMSWVMAECRARLWRSAELAGFDHVVYMDTDSLIVDPTGSERLLQAAVPGLRRKSVHDTLEVLGPRQIITGGQLRASGVPRGAVRVSPDEWESDVWAQLGTSLAQHEPELVRIVTRRIRLKGLDRRRAHVIHGQTEPFRLSE